MLPFFEKHTLLLTLLLALLLTLLLALLLTLLTVCTDKYTVFSSNEFVIKDGTKLLFVPRFVREETICQSFLLKKVYVL